MRISVLCLILSAGAASAQEPPMAFPPPAAGIGIATNVAYAPGLAMDVYTPPSPRSGAPALVFFNRATGEERRGRFYDGWARTAASNGIVAILPDLRSGSEAADFRTLMSYLGAHKAERGIGAIAVYAGSGNVFAALPAIEDPGMTGLAAAVIYYGGGSVSDVRLDLPLLVVRAGLDRPGMNDAVDVLIHTAILHNAPISVINDAGGHHAFELADDDAVSRAVIEETLAFVRRTTSAEYQSALRASLPEATAAGQVRRGMFHDAAATYARLAAAQPGNARLRLAYGEALLGDQQYAAACAAFDALRDKGLGFRDLGLPAAEACLKKGDADAAIAWLKSIPPQFRPASLRESPAFAALRNRPDFQALFPPRLM